MSAPASVAESRAGTVGGAGVNESDPANVKRGKRNRNRGANYERELVNAFKEHGLQAQRVPLSGATGYAKNDVEVIAGFDGKTVFSGEAKRRAGLPEYMTKALDGADFAAFRQDRGETLIVLRLETFAQLLQ